jgi:hypothetical protein
VRTSRKPFALQNSCFQIRYQWLKIYKGYQISFRKQKKKVKICCLRISGHLDKHVWHVRFVIRRLACDERPIYAHPTAHAWSMHINICIKIHLPLKWRVCDKVKQHRSKLHGPLVAIKIARRQRTERNRAHARYIICSIACFRSSD